MHRYHRIVLVFTLLFAGGAFAQEAKKDGWWIKVDAQKQKPQTMAFYVGSNNHSYGFWKVWNPGDPAEFDVSEEYRNSPTLFILAQTTSGLQCRICVMYKSKGVRPIEFDLEDSREMKQSDEDKGCD